MRKQIHDINGVLIDFSNTLFDCRNVISPEKIVQKLKTKGASIDVITAQDFCDAILENANSEDGLKKRKNCDLSYAKHQKIWREIAVETIGKRHSHFIEIFMDALDDPENWLPFSDTHHFLQILKALNKKICIVSNIAWDIREAFRIAGLYQFVDHFVLSYEVGVMKPNEEFFDLACQSIDCVRRQVLMVGDDQHADNAEQLGIKTYIFPDKFPETTMRGLLKVIDFLGDHSTTL